MFQRMGTEFNENCPVKARKGGYRVVCVFLQLETVYKEHIHIDKEIRLCTEGSGYFDVHYRPFICPCRIRVENALKTHVKRISFPTRISKIQSKPTIDTR